ncbi:hypothetical protein NLJ89_g7569 [Agrocybe chaxingu]|uniref:Uncharacterized protein n=1 Tax=Agrocybe chaxingu TaxID=84603 RepID=A0A9W8MRM2_9AGAR|nr:hypothetical protein NLJ89_g7569 [Agrocybe chaxingu]
MLDNLYPLLDKRRSPPGQKKTRRTTVPTDLQDAKLRFQESVLAFADKRLPFRDHAPSRRRILEPNGPYAPSNISTISGLFSALVYRGISHNTQFLLENEYFFATLSEFNVLHVQLQLDGHNADYFCNKAAYGVTTRRSVNDASTYWEKAQNPSLNAFLTRSTPVNFLRLYFLILRSKIPGFGPLTSFQLALDYAIAKKATMPTVKEMAHVIFKLKMGGLKGLIRLGYSVTTEHEVACALYSLRAQLDERIPTGTKKRIAFGIVFVEHLLCKFGRLDAKPFQDLEEVIASGSRL